MNSTLAIFNALKHFRTYPLGIQFTIFTDFNAIKATSKKRVLIPRVARWWIYLQDINFVVQYRKENKVPHVDYLSRNLSKVKHQTWAEIEQTADKETPDLIAALESGSLGANHKHKSLYHIAQSEISTQELGLVFSTTSIVTWGPTKLFRPFKIIFGSLFVRKYIARCLKSKIRKAHTGPKQGLLHSLEKAPFGTIHLDCLGPPTEENFKHFETVNEFKQFISFFGTPRPVITDSGTHFQSREFNDLCAEWCIELHFITPGIRRGNGQAERYVRTISNNGQAAFGKQSVIECNTAEINDG
ncbi:hypothetical protein J437_LFUL017310, partial [Ladona fulva]